MILPLLTKVAVPQAWAQQGNSGAGGNLLTVIVVDFVNKSSVGGDALARFATDAVAVELASSARFEVLKRDEVLRTANELGYRAPYDKSQLTRIAQTLGASAVVTGDIKFVRDETRKGQEKTVNVGLAIRVTEASSGELINGAAQIGSSQAKPGLSDTVSLANEAISKSAVLGVRQILTYSLPEGIIINTVGRVDSLQVLINRGSRDGIKEGQELLVMRDKQRVGRIKVTRTFPADSEAVVVDLGQGLRPMDGVRAVFPMPELDERTGIVSGAKVRSGSNMGSIGKLLIVIGVGAVIATAMKGSASVTGVVAEADTVNGASAVTLHWRDNLFSGNTLEYHVWRLPDNPYNFQGTPTAAVQQLRQYTDFPSPAFFWDGVRGFLQPSTGGNNNNGGGNNGGNGTASTVTPAAGTGIGFTVGRSMNYQVSAVVRRTALSNGNQNGGNQGGGGNQQTLEDVETSPVNSGQVTPINQPAQNLPQDLQQSIDLRNVNFSWLSRSGADVFQVEVSTDRSFRNRNLIAQLPMVFSTAPSSDGVIQTLSPAVNLTTNQTLRRDPGFANFVNHVPNAARPTLFWRVGCRNNSDSPGPVHWISRDSHASDRSFRFIYSLVRSFQPADLPPPGP